MFIVPLQMEEITFHGAADEIKARIYRPKFQRGETLPCLVYFHGGGFVMLSVGEWFIYKGHRNTILSINRFSIHQHIVNCV